MWVIDIVAGPGASTQATFDGERLVIGSGVDCGFTIKDSTLERYHAEFSWSRSPTQLYVAAATIGAHVLVNGAPIDSRLLRNFTPFSPEDRITIGSTVLTVTFRDTARP